MRRRTPASVFQNCTVCMEEARVSAVSTVTPSRYTVHLQIAILWLRHIPSPLVRNHTHQTACADFLNKILLCCLKFQSIIVVSWLAVLALCMFIILALCGFDDISTGSCSIAARLRLLPNFLWNYRVDRRDALRAAFVDVTGGPVGRRNIRYMVVTTISTSGFTVRIHASVRGPVRLSGASSMRQLGKIPSPPTRWRDHCLFNPFTCGTRYETENHYWGSHRRFVWAPISRAFRIKSCHEEVVRRAKEAPWNKDFFLKKTISGSLYVRK